MKNSMKKIIIMLVCGGFMNSAAFAGFVCQSADGDLNLTASHEQVQEVFLSIEDEVASIKIEKNDQDTLSFDSVVSKQTNRVGSFYMYKFDQDLTDAVSFSIAEVYTIDPSTPFCHQHSRITCTSTFALKHTGTLHLNGESHALDCKIM